MLVFGTGSARADFVEKGPLSLDTELTARKFVAGKLPPLAVRPANVSARLVTVNAQFLVKDQNFSAHESVIHLTGPDKETPNYLPQVFAAETGEAQFNLSAPGAGAARVNARGAPCARARVAETC